MGVYTRKDSCYFWLYLEPLEAGTYGLRERTKIRCDAPTAQQRKDNRAIAEQLYHVKMTAHVRGVITPEAKPSSTFAVFAGWFEAHKLPHRRGREREAEILPRLVRAFGDLSLTAITPKTVQERWITPRLTMPTTIAKKRRTAARTVQAGPSTVNREVDLLKAILAAAVPEYFDRSPLYGMKRLRTPTPQRRLLSHAEEARLLKAMAKDDRALFLIGQDALVRLSDILDVKWTDRHGDRLWIGDPKAGGGFDALLSKRTRKALDQVPANSSDYIFARRRRASTERDRRHGIAQMLKRACVAATPKVPYGRLQGGITFHWATRRTGATRMLTRGHDVGTVQKIGRWKKPDVVLGIYHELIDEAQRAAVESVGRRRQRA